MKYNSVFDIISPVMIGPPSSHNAGAVRSGKAARHLFGKESTWASVHLYESFAKTHIGMGPILHWRAVCLISIQVIPA